MFKDTMTKWPLKNKQTEQHKTRRTPRRNRHLETRNVFKKDKRRRIKKKRKYNTS